jgi:hypothetical protein
MECLIVYQELGITSDGQMLHNDTEHKLYV